MEQNSEFVRREIEIEGNRPIDERMATAANLQLPTNLRHEPVHFHRISRARAEIIERDTHLPCRGDRVALGAQHVGQLA